MTDIIDHTLSFPNEAAAFGVLSGLGFAFRDQNNNIVWDGRIVDPTVKLITADAVVDGNGDVITPEEIIAGFHVSIALSEASDDLEALPNNFLRLIENRMMTGLSKKFHEYAVSFKSLPEGVASNMPPAQINRVGGLIENLTFKISPRWLWHTDYPVPF